MVTSLAVHPITVTNTRSTTTALVQCLWPGDDNHNNLMVVAEATKLAEEMDRGCRLPRINPHAADRAIVHCTAGWTVDGKAAVASGGWGPWVGKQPQIDGRDMCTKADIHTRNYFACAHKSRQIAHVEAFTAADTYHAQCVIGADEAGTCGEQVTALATSVVAAGLVQELVLLLEFYVMRLMRLHIALHKAVSMLPSIVDGVKAALALQRAMAGTSPAERQRRTRAHIALDTVMPNLKLFRKSATPKAIGTQLGSSEPLKKLAGGADLLFESATVVLEKLSSETDPTPSELISAEESAEAVTAALESAVKAQYWQNDKAGRVIRYYKDGGYC